MIKLDPLTKSNIHIKLFKNVGNLPDLRQKLLSGEMNCCLIKPSLICDQFQVAVAANKALVSEKITTKSIFTEILYNLSISKNITNSLKTFGIDDNDTDLLIVTIIKDGEQDQSEVYKQVKGQEVNVSSLCELCDVNLIKKTYKISEEEAKSVPLIDSVVSRIATKDILSH